METKKPNWDSAQNLFGIGGVYGASAMGRGVMVPSGTFHHAERRVLESDLIVDPEEEFLPSERTCAIAIKGD